MKILIVDDEPIHVLLLQDMLSQSGYTAHKGFTDVELALSLFRDFQPDLVIVDAKLPPHNECGLLQQVCNEIPDCSYIPVLALLECNDRQLKLRALNSGATDYLAKPFEHTEAMLRINNLLHARLMFLQAA